MNLVSCNFFSLYLISYNIPSKLYGLFNYAIKYFVHENNILKLITM